MGKDPAFLFYDGDAARDVSHMNRLERGCYFDFIQAQRKFGKLKQEQVKKILGADFDECWPSLEMILSHEGEYYFIEWVSISVAKRKAHAEKQRKRIQDYWDNKKRSDLSSMENPPMPEPSELTEEEFQLFHGYSTVLP